MRWRWIFALLLAGPPMAVWHDRDALAAFADDGRAGRDQGRSTGGGAQPGGGGSLSQVIESIVGRAIVEGRDVVAREVVGLGLDAADLTALAEAGFAVISADPLGALGEALHRLRVPDEPSLPDAHLDVIAAAAVDARKRAWRGGNRGAYAEVAGSGVDVLSAGPGGGPRPAGAHRRRSRRAGPRRDRRLRPRARARRKVLVGDECDALKA